jgi:hypothetical protein
MINSTIVRAHQTKIHVLADALGNTMKFILTGGEKSDFL